MVTRNWATHISGEMTRMKNQLNIGHHRVFRKIASTRLSQHRPSHWRAQVAPTLECKVVYEADICFISIVRLYI